MMQLDPSLMDLDVRIPDPAAALCRRMASSEVGVSRVDWHARTVAALIRDFTPLTGYGWKAGGYARQLSI